MGFRVTQKLTIFLTNYTFKQVKEVWCLREDFLSSLRSFHHRSVRTMCRINMVHTIRHRISPTASLLYLPLNRAFGYPLSQKTPFAGRATSCGCRLADCRACYWIVRDVMQTHAPSVALKPQVTCERTLKWALRSKDLPNVFVEGTT